MRKNSYNRILREKLNKQYLSTVPKFCPLYYYFDDKSETIASQQHENNFLFYFFKNYSFFVAYLVASQLTRKV